MTGHKSGCFQFIASGLQEAVDYTVIAHYIAERALVPGLLVLDFDMEATVPVQMPSETDLRKFLGNSDDAVDSPTAAQQMIFGKTRVVISTKMQNTWC